MDATVRHQFLESKPCDFSAHRIEARHNNCVGRVVDDHVDSGDELEGANVSSFAADDASFHLIIR